MAMHFRDTQRRLVGTWAQLSDDSGKVLGILHVDGVDTFNNAPGVYGRVFDGKTFIDPRPYSLETHSISLDYPLSTYRNVDTTTVHYRRSPIKQYTRGLTFNNTKTTLHSPSKNAQQHDLAWAAWNPIYEEAETAIEKIRRKKAHSRALSNEVRISRLVHITLPVVEVSGVIVGVINKNNSLTGVSPEILHFSDRLIEVGLEIQEILE